MRQISIRPGDVAVALALSLEEGQSYTRLAESVGVSLGEAHNAVRRLVKARLVAPDDRRPVRSALVDYVSRGVPYSFPAELGAETRGVATATAAEPLASEFASAPVTVWPSSEGPARGQSVTPLYPGATDLPRRNPALYRLLTLVDAVRIGQARERKRATELLAEAILASPGT